MRDATVFLVRHGEVHNPERINYGRLPGFRLSERGRAEVRSTAVSLRSRLQDGLVVYSSPLERAVETAELLCSELALSVSVRTDERLLEAASRFDGLPRGGAPLAHLRRVVSSEKSEHESPVQIADRMISAVEAFSREAPMVLAVSHQRPIQYARMGFSRAPRARGDGWIGKISWSMRPPCATASVTMLVLRDGQWKESAYWEQ